MDEKLAEAHEILARAKFSYDWDWAGAEKEFRRARELNPSVRGFPFDSHAGLLAATGRFDESVAEIKRIHGLDPNPGHSHFDLGFVLYWARRYDEASEHFQKAIQANSATLAHFFLRFAYAQKSRFKEAVEGFEAARVTPEGNAGALAGLSYGYALAGRKDDAIRLLRELEEGYKQPFVRFPTRVPAAMRLPRTGLVL